jgi:hypothetical protein
MFHFLLGEALASTLNLRKNPFDFLYGEIEGLCPIPITEANS